MDNGFIRTIRMLSGRTQLWRGQNADKPLTRSKHSRHIGIDHNALAKRRAKNKMRRATRQMQRRAAKR